LKKIFIAEIGNNHFGSFQNFRELVSAAKDSGATHVKSQLFNPLKLKGSMPVEFYQKCAEIHHRLPLLEEIAEKAGIHLFFSCFDAFEEYEAKQKFKKIAAPQSEQIFRHGKVLKRWFIDNKNVIISLGKGIKHFPILSKAVVLHASEYLTDTPNLGRITEMMRFYDNVYGREKGLVGYSDHTIGIRACIDAIEIHGANYIEKHFTIKKNLKYNGVVFRDTVHGATPKEFQELTRRY